ncbi:MAG: transposase [Bacteroidales bacterium]|nr:transposase [Bacteroidales bacterium]
MSQGYQIKDQTAAHYVTLQIVQWVDIFTRKLYRDIVIDSLKYCQKEKGLEVYAFVIMSNHIHLLVRSGQENLSGTLRDFKSYTSKEILKVIIEKNESRIDWLLMVFKYAANKHKRNSTYQVWTHENHAEEIYSNKFIEQKLDYIHNNPVRAGIVTNPEDYLYSSARNYASLESVLDVIEVSRTWKTY